MKNFIFIVMVSASIIFTTSFSVVSWENKILNNIITVDDEGDGDFTSIKEALNIANPRDVIEVYSGTYYENNVSIVKEEITLRGISNELGNGNDKGKPFIDGQGNGGIIDIEANNVIFTGFRIENKLEGNGGCLINIGLNVNSCIISDNDLANTTSHGINIMGSDNKISNNNLSNCNGIHFGVSGFFGPSKNLICRNTIFNSPSFGICVDYSRNIIIKNKVIGCGHAGIGNYGSFNLFMYNTMENNSIGFQQTSEFPNYIIYNNFINNDIEVYLYIILFVPAFTMRTNRFSHNFWGEPRTSPYPIIGKFPLFNRTFYDWFPAQDPYDII